MSERARITPFARGGFRLPSRCVRSSMPELVGGTTYILADEPCLNLAEVNLIAPKNDGTSDTDWYRFQIILVVRDDKPTEYRERLGLAKDFKASGINIIGGGRDGITGKLWSEETVGRLRDMAEEMRNEPQFDLQELSYYQLEGLL